MCLRSNKTMAQYDLTFEVQWILKSRTFLEIKVLPKWKFSKIAMDKNCYSKLMLLLEHLYQNNLSNFCIIKALCQNLHSTGYTVLQNCGHTTMAGDRVVQGWVLKFVMISRRVKQRNQLTVILICRSLHQIALPRTAP